MFLPVEAGTGMRAPVVISKEFTILVYHKNRLRFTFDFEFETSAAGVFDIASFAKNVGHDLW